MPSVVQLKKCPKITLDTALLLLYADSVPHQVWTDSKRLEVRQLRQTLELALTQLDKLVRGAGRPIGTPNRPRLVPITLELATQWLSDSFASTYATDVLSAATLEHTKHIVAMTLCYKGPWRNGQEMSEWLAREHSVVLNHKQISQILSVLREEGFAVQRGGGWENYWHGHPMNDFRDGQWSKPVQWVPPLTVQQKRELMKDNKV